ncbi:MAG: monomeric [FeFe] hydrogenase [Thermodesulfobacteriota bacterium]|nr:monomeric [FeFe] hydrogenase [Thermodesulfobacteriota bacterium]
MKYNSVVTRIRGELLARITRAFLDGNLLERIDYFPVEMRPRHSEPTRCCIYKDRAIIRERCIALLGFNIEDDLDELIPLSEYAATALTRQAPEENILTVLDDACRACTPSRYFVTNVCHACVDHPCIQHCPKKAISFKNGHQAHIDFDKCVVCGKCQKVCPFHAIVRIPIPCEEACPVGAISKDSEGKEHIDFSKCIFCGKCLNSCPFGAVIQKSQALDVLKALGGKRPVSALLAPSAAGQFQGDIYRLAGALKTLGFERVVEVALGAEQTARMEAEELNERLGRGEKFMTTSCCPAWFQAVEKHLHELKPHVSKTPTPMHFTAADEKQRNLQCVTVFIGPCIAKRNEAIKDAEVDFVLTFEELEAIFEGSGIDPAIQEPATFDREAGREGRGFPVAEGVASAVMAFADSSEIRCLSINGLDKKTMTLLKTYAKKNDAPAELLEIMSCEGGCIAGPEIQSGPTISAKRVQDLLGKSSSST